MPAVESLSAALPSVICRQFETLPIAQVPLLPVGSGVIWNVAPLSKVVVLSNTFLMLSAVLQVLNGISWKSFSVAVNDCDERVCGTNVLRQLLNPSAFRFTPPSKNLLMSTVDCGAPLTSRQTQPPQSTAAVPLVTAFTASATPAGTPVIAVGQFFGSTLLQAMIW